MKGFNIIKQAQKLQAKLQEIQKELENKTVTATSGGGMVKVIANGKQEILSIEIDPEVVDPNDIEMLQDLILAAVNKALEEARNLFAEAMTSVTGNIKIPGLF